MRKQMLVVGILTLLFTTQVSAQCQGDCQNGYGTFTRLDGSIYTGMNKKGQRHGDGMVAWETGDTLRGSWNEGKMDNESIFTYSNGDQMIMSWEKGKMEEEVSYIFN